MTPSTSSRARAIAMACLAAMAFACNRTDEKVVGPGAGEGIAVHGVLDPALKGQVILVERLLTGAEAVETNTLFDTLDAVRTGGGLPLTGARVVVYREDTGDSAVAREDVTVRGDGRGAGMYRIINKVLATLAEQTDPRAVSLLPGVRYALRVTAADGRVVTGATTIPGFRGDARRIESVPFNRDRDSLFIFWQEVPGAARYTVRVESPRGPVLNFVDSLEYLVSGTLRDASESPFPRVFIPGFQQSVSVSAADTNYYDYYRSRNDPYSGRGLVNHLQGGVGVFGSIAVVQDRVLLVSADSTEAIEGLYRRGASSAPNAPIFFRLYRDQEVAPRRLWLSGFHSSGGITGLPGMLGELLGDQRLTLAFLRAQSAADTVLTLDARFDGFNRIFGTVRGTGQQVEYFKQ